jgi:hypothetical protein
MKALEFTSSLNADDTLTVPSVVAQQVRSLGLPLRVLLLVAESEERDSWEQLTAEQFFAGYSDADKVYDSLPSG